MKKRDITILLVLLVVSCAGEITQPKVKALEPQKLDVSINSHHTEPSLVELQTTTTDVTTTTTRSYGERIQDSLTGFLIGLLLFIISFPLLAWNEYKSAKQYRLFGSAESEVVSNQASDVVLPKNNGKLIHVTGTVSTNDALRDPDVGISQRNCLKLKRTVEMFQWNEVMTESRRDNLGGSETITRTYSYERDWYEHPINSNDFKEKGHENPLFPHLRSDEFRLRQAEFGAFSLGPAMIDQAKWYLPRNITEEEMDELTPQFREFVLEHGRLYRGKSPATPTVGDVRISYHKVECGHAAAMGKQVQNTFAPWEPVYCSCLRRAEEDEGNDDEKQRLLSSGGSSSFDLVRPDYVLWFDQGRPSAKAMVERRRAENAVWTWILRLIGFLCMFFGMELILNPIVILFKVVPFFANLLSVGIFLVCFVSSLILSAVIVIVCWVLVRPFLVLLIAACVVSVIAIASSVH